MTIAPNFLKAVEMPNPLDEIDLTDEDIQSSWRLFKECEADGKSHQWRDEPKTSVFYRRCDVCGGAEGIRFPEDHYA